MNWTDERTELAKRLWLEGKSAADVAKALGHVSRNAVIGKVHRMGLSRSKGLVNYIRNDGLTHRERYTIKRRQARAHIAKPTRAELEARAIAKKRDKLISKFTEAQAAWRETGPSKPPVLLTGHERLWTERGFGQCAFPVAGGGADTLSCCAPTGGKVYCPAHRKLMYQPRSTMTPHDRKYYAERAA